MVFGVIEQFKVSERRSCLILDQVGSTQRYKPRILSNERQLKERVIALADQYGRYGYRRVTALLQREGWRVNHPDPIVRWDIDPQQLLRFNQKVLLLNIHTGTNI